MAKHGFVLALEKTEVLVLTKERVPTVLPIQVGETMVLLKPSVKYLGIMIETKMSFFEQICSTADNAAVRMIAICRLMSNVGDPLSSRRRLLIRMVQSDYFYGSEIWVDSLSKELYRKSLVSESAVMVIAGVISICCSLGEEGVDGPRISYKTGGRGEVNYYLSKLLSGHGYFQSYRHTTGNSRSPDCIYCKDVMDDVCPTIFFCRRWGCHHL